MTESLSDSAKKVQDALIELGLTVKVVELPDSTRTAQEAAQAIGCQVAQIVKTLVFKGKESGRAILVLASGTNRVNEKFLSALAGEPIVKADADFVRRQTGFAIGGVPPIAHSQPLLTFVDKDLFQHSEIWAAAGTPHAVFRLAPEDLGRIIQGEVVQIA